MSGDWRQHSEDLTVRLANLVRLDGSPDAHDLEAALHVRRAVAALATDVLFDVSGLHRHAPRRWDTSEIHLHPVEHLARVLQSHAQPLPERSLSDCLADEAVGPDGQIWRRAAADAVLAHHEWNRLDELDRRLGTEAWTAVHEVAQFSQALTWLDEGIADSCRAAGRRDDAQSLLGGVSRLRGAARAVMTLASSGPLPVLRHRTAPVARAALVIRRPEHLPAGLERLTHLLNTADHVSPKHVQAAYRLLSRLSSDACSVLATTDHPTSMTPTAPERVSSTAALTDDAGAFSRALRSAGCQPGRANSLEASDPAVVVQLQLLGTLVAVEPSLGGRARARGESEQLRQTALEVLRASTSTADALSGVTVRCVEDRKWLVPAGVGGVAGLTWVPSWPHQANAFDPDSPPLLRAGVDARRLGVVVSDGLTPLSRGTATGVAVSRPPASRRLSAALLSAERQASPMAVRPADPRARPHR